MRSDVHREIARLLAQLRRYCSVAINKQLSVVGASLHEFVVLVRLSEEDEVPQSELPYDAAIDPAAVSRLIRDMTSAGLVTAHVDPADKRQRFVRITAKGRTMLRTLAPVVDSAVAPYLSGLTAQEEQEFVRLLRKAHATAAAVAAEGEAKAEASAPRLSSGRPRARRSQSPA